MRFHPALRFALALLFSVLPACGSRDEPGPAQGATAGGERAADPGRVARPFVWRVEGASGPSYLLGTIHVAVSLEDALPAELVPALDQARVVLLEADASPDQITPEVVARYGLVDGNTAGLDQRLTPAQWTRLTTELGPLGIPAEALARMRAWLPAMTLVVARTQQLPGANAAAGPDGRPVAMDQEILTRARSGGRQLRFLETVEDQLALFAGLGEDHMLEWLGEMLDASDGPGADIEAMIAAYRAGDLEGIERTTFEDEDMAEHPEYVEAMFTRRNQAWLPALRQELERGGAFVAVGAGHFVGPRGLLRLLSAEGIEAVRIPAAR